MRQKNINGLALQFDESAGAFYYQFPGSGNRLFFDESANVFLPVAPDGGNVVRERMAGAMPDGSTYYGERVTVPAQIVEYQLQHEAETLLARIEFLKWLRRLAWAGPVVIIAVLITFGFSVAEHLNKVASEKVAKSAATALADITYWAIVFLAIIIAGCVLLICARALFGGNASAKKQDDDNVCDPATGSVNININQGWGQALSAQTLVNNRNL